MDGEIRLPIEVVDNATAALNGIIKSFNQFKDTTDEINKKSSFGDKIVNGIDSAVGKIDKFLNKASKGEKIMQSFGVKTTGAFSQFVSGNTVEGVKALMDMSDEATTLQGKLALALDQGSSVNAFKDKIKEAANEARVSFDAIAEGVTGIGLAAGDMFNDDELLQFTKSLSMLYKIGGATTQETQAAMVQIRQALAKGKLQGDEFKSLSSLPGFMDIMAKELKVTKGEVKELASEGKITAEVFKKAMLGATGELEAKIKTIPMTFKDRFNEVNNSLKMFQNKLGLLFNKLANCKQAVIVFEALKKVFDKLTYAARRFTKWLDKFQLKDTADDIEDVEKKADSLANILLGVLLVAVGLLIGKVVLLGLQWIVTGIQAFIATLSVMWPLYLVIAIIALVIYIVMQMGATFQEVCQFIGAFIGFTIALVWNLFLSLVDLILGCVNILGRAFFGIANFFGNVWKDPISSVIYLFRDLANTVLGILKAIASAIDKLFGSNLAGAVQGWMNGVDDLADKAADKWGNGEYDKNEWEDIKSESLGFKRMDYIDAGVAGYQIGDKIGNGIVNGIEGIKGLFSKIDDIKDSTDMMGKGLNDYDASTGTGSLSTKLDEDTVDELKAFAEIQYRLSYKHITPNVNVNFGDVHETADVQDITKYIKKMMEKDLEEIYITEGGQ